MLHISRFVMFDTSGSLPKLKRVIDAGNTDDETITKNHKKGKFIRAGYRSRLKHVLEHFYISYAGKYL